jgi:hypothetical protein
MRRSFIQIHNVSQFEYLVILKHENETTNRVTAELSTTIGSNLEINSRYRYCLQHMDIRSMGHLTNGMCNQWTDESANYALWTFDKFHELDELD